VCGTNRQVRHVGLRPIVVPWMRRVPRHGCNFDSVSPQPGKIYEGPLVHSEEVSTRPGWRLRGSGARAGGAGPRQVREISNHSAQNDPSKDGRDVIHSTDPADVYRMGSTLENPIYQCFRIPTRSSTYMVPYSCQSSGQAAYCTFLSIFAPGCVWMRLPAPNGG
jgi:hypothetical protein